MLFGGRDLASLFLDLGADADPVFLLPAPARFERLYDDDIGLEYICEATNLSLYYFSRLFQRETGMSPVQYLARYRVEKAKELLTSTSQTIGEIARMVGLPNQFTVARNFREVAGTSPTPFRAAATTKR